MAFIGEWIRRLAYLLRRRALEDELRREVEAHRALLEEPRAFGNTLRLRDEARDAWGWTWLDDFVQDARFALRTLRHSPGFTLTTVATLALGIGVKSYVVSRRTREFGIRMAIGAHPRAVLWQVLREGGRITAAGIGIGMLLALGAGQVLQSFLYGVDAVEPVVLIAAPLILRASSVLASYIPARRATKVDPTVALRSE
jgi:ABC-type antimicrobial peptide transport system permease subunit